MRDGTRAGRGRKLAAVVCLTLAAGCSGSGGGGGGTPQTGSTHAISGTIAGTGGLAMAVTLSGADDATATSDGTGRYVFGGLADGTYTITPSRAGWTFVPATRTVAVAGGDLVAQDFTGSMSGGSAHTLSGTVSGSVVEGVTVALDGTSVSSTTTTGADGSYAFTGLGDDDYVVTPSLAGYVFTPDVAYVTVAGADATQGFVAAPDPFLTGCSITFGEPISATFGCRVESDEYSTAVLGAVWYFSLSIPRDTTDVNCVFDLGLSAQPAAGTTYALTDSVAVSSYSQVVHRSTGYQWLGGKSDSGAQGVLSVVVTSQDFVSSTATSTIDRPHGTLHATVPHVLGAVTDVTVDASF